MGETFYDVLGLGRDASQADIESAYRERVKETHPDVNDSPDAADSFQRVQSAERVLGDPDERARYDRLGHGSYTSHFGASPAEEGSGWDFGSDRSAEEARDGGGDGRWGGRDDGGDGRQRGRDDGDRTGGESAGDDGFGFDPGAYDRTHERPGDGNPSERSYDVSGGEDGPDDADEGLGDGATASASTGAGSATAAGASAANGGDGRATASTGAGAGANETADADWREQARRTQREWSKATQREGRGSTDDEPSGYSVHDWDDDEVETETTRYSLEGSEFVAVAITFVLYPFMAYSTIAPAFPMFVNAVVGLCALALTGYLLTMPRIGFLVFGAWSVLAPAFFFAVPALELVSIVGFVVLGTTWIPFAYSILFLHVLD